MEIRWMCNADYPAVLDIENRSYDQPWHESDFRRMLRKKYVTALVGIIQGKVRAFVVYAIEAAAICPITLGVHPAWRRRGFGTALVQKLKGLLIAGRREYIGMLVPEVALGAQCFLRANRFLCLKICKESQIEGGVGYGFEYALPTATAEQVVQVANNRWAALGEMG